MKPTDRDLEKLKEMVDTAVELHQGSFAISPLLLSRILEEIIADRKNPL